MKDTELYHLHLVRKFQMSGVEVSGAIFVTCMLDNYTVRKLGKLNINRKVDPTKQWIWEEYIIDKTFTFSNRLMISPFTSFCGACWTVKLGVSLNKSSIPVAGGELLSSGFAVTIFSAVWPLPAATILGWLKLIGKIQNRIIFTPKHFLEKNE